MGELSPDLTEDEYKEWLDDIARDAHDHFAEPLNPDDDIHADLLEHNEDISPGDLVIDFLDVDLYDIRMWIDGRCDYPVSVVEYEDDDELNSSEWHDIEKASGRRSVRIKANRLLARAIHRKWNKMHDHADIVVIE